MRSESIRSAKSESTSDGGFTLVEVVIAMMLLLVAIPLTVSSIVVIQQRSQESEVLEVSQTWAREQDWDVVSIATREGRTVLRLTGPLPIPDTDSLRQRLASAGVDVATVRAEFIPSETVDFDQT